jgi:hypothetical protein
MKGLQSHNITYYNMQRGTIMLKKFILFQFFWPSDKKHHGIVRKIPKNTNSTI